MKKYLDIFIWLVIFISVTNVAHSRDFSYADAVPFIGLEGQVKNLKKTVFCIQSKGNMSNKSTDDDWLSHGTGFLLVDKNKEYIGITCKHVIQSFIKGKKLIYGGFDTDKGYFRLACVINHIDKEYDVAILKFKKPETEGDISIKNLIFPEELIDTDNSSIVEGRGVVITGYPLSLGVEDDKNHPVVRIGIIAQFTGKEYLLVDGFASHGNSGSPVFSLKYKERKLVGMVTSYINDNITLYNESGKITAALPYNSGLARVITMKTINDYTAKSLS